MGIDLCHDIHIVCKAWNWWKDNSVRTILDLSVGVCLIPPSHQHSIKRQTASSKILNLIIVAKERDCNLGRQPINRAPL